MMNVEIQTASSAGVPCSLGGFRERMARDMSVGNLLRALAAILFWSLLIGAISCIYELWRLEHNWRRVWHDNHQRHPRPAPQSAMRALHP